MKRLIRAAARPVLAGAFLFGAKGARPFSRSQQPKSKSAAVTPRRFARLNDTDDG
jgi:hypothetical protein